MDLYKAGLKPSKSKMLRVTNYHYNVAMWQCLVSDQVPQALGIAQNLEFCKFMTQILVTVGRRRIVLSATISKWFLVIEKIVDKMAS